MNISVTHKVFVGAAMLLATLLVACEGGVDEAASGTVVAKVEESSLGPGATAHAVLDLSPGKYVLICNISGHYKQGMYAALQVTDGARGAGANVEIGEWFVKPSVASVAPGSITLEVTNKGKSSHNLVVIRTDRAPEALVVK